MGARRASNAGSVGRQTIGEEPFRRPNILIRDVTFVSNCNFAAPGQEVKSDLITEVDKVQLQLPSTRK